MRDVLGKARRDAQDHASSISPARALGVPAEELADEIVAVYRIDPLDVRFDDVEAEQDEVRVDVSQDWNRMIFDRGRAFYLPGTQLTFIVPYTGDPELVSCAPSTFMSSGPPEGSASATELRYVYTTTEADQAKALAAFAQWRSKAEQYIGWVNSEAREYNDSLGPAVRAAIDARIAKVRADRELAAGLGIPIRRRDDAPRTYAVPAVRKRPEIRRPTANSAKSAPLEPAMTTREYEVILEIMGNMVLVMERSPSAFKDMAEEDLRQHFLVQLNSQYEFDTGAEMFNYEGKTDILVRYEGRTVFIAECKFWGGPKALSDAVDQLLGYTSWRDTKTAILLFNRKRSFTAVLDKIPGAIADHPNFVADLGKSDETTFRFTMKHRDDDDRHLTLTIMAFDLPT